MTGILGAIAGMRRGLSVTVSGTAVYNGASGNNRTTSSVTATGTPSGGTFAWSYVSGDNFTIVSPTSATTTFRTNLASGASLSGVYRVTYTLSGATATADISVFFNATN
jgi:hypothetical protein